MRIYLSIFLFAAIQLASQDVSPKNIKKDKPNFIFILTDDQRYDLLGANDNNIIHTPNLDK